MTEQAIKSVKNIAVQLFSVRRRNVTAGNGSGEPQWHTSAPTWLQLIMVLAMAIGSGAMFTVSNIQRLSDRADSADLAMRRQVQVTDTLMVNLATIDKNQNGMMKQLETLTLLLRDPTQNQKH